MKVSRLKPEAETEQSNNHTEWYAQLCSSSFPGKFFVLFVHANTRLSVIVRGKSLLKTIPTFQERLELLLIRHSIPMEKRALLLPTGEPLILKTNSRSVLGHLNDFVTLLSYTFTQYPTFESIDLNYVEDLMAKYLIGLNKNYVVPIELVRNLDL